MDFITTARAEFARLHDETAQQIEAAKDREYTADEKTAQDARFARMDVLKGKLDEHAKFTKLAFEKGDVTLPKNPPGKEEYEAYRNGGNVEAKADQIDRAEFGRAAGRWASTGEMERKFATITTSTQSSILLPKTVVAPLVPTAANVFREAHALYGLTPVTTGDTGDINWPVMSATAGGIVAENASSETENTPSLSESFALNAATYQSGAVYFSNKVIRANSFDLLTAVVPELQYSKELGIESAATAAIIADAGITQVVATATTTGFTYANLVDLNRKLSKKFDRLKVIILGADAYAAAEKLTGDDGHPVLNRDPQNDSLLKFNGTPVLRSDYLEAFGASKVVGLIVSMTGFKLRDCDGEELQRFDRVTSKPNQTGLNLFGYHGYGYAVSAIAKLKTPAS
jgi:HK97 family phage major capsid protein